MSQAGVEWAERSQRHKTITAQTPTDSAAVQQLLDRATAIPTAGLHEGAKQRLPESRHQLQEAQANLDTIQQSLLNADCDAASVVTWKWHVVDERLRVLRLIAEAASTMLNAFNQSRELLTQEQARLEKDSVDLEARIVESLKDLGFRATALPAEAIGGEQHMIQLRCAARASVLAEAARNRVAETQGRLDGGNEPADKLRCLLADISELRQRLLSSI